MKLEKDEVATRVEVLCIVRRCEIPVMKRIDENLVIWGRVSDAVLDKEVRGICIDANKRPADGDRDMAKDEGTQGCDTGEKRRSSLRECLAAAVKGMS